MAARSHSLANLFDRAPSLFWDGEPEDRAEYNPDITPERAPIPPPVIEMAPPAAPAVTLREHLGGVELLLETLDDIADADPRTAPALIEALTAGIAAARVSPDELNSAIAMYEGLEASAEREIERLKARRDRLAAQRETLGTCVIEVLQAWGMQKLTGETSTLALKKNPPAVEILDELAIPAKFKKYKPAPPATPNKTLIASELKAGRDVPGARMQSSVRLVRS